MASKTTDISLELGDRLGKGSYGAVFKARQAGFKILNYEEFAPMARNCAVKTSPKNPLELIHEYNILKRLRGCDNIVSVFGIGDNPTYGKVMVIERLYDTLQYRAENMPHAQKTTVFVRYLADLFSALQFLAEHNIVHTDLHWRNIMFDRNMNAPILIDFGLAQEINLEQNKFVQFPFKPNLLWGDVSHNWRRWHPPEQWVGITQADIEPYLDSDMESDTDSEDPSPISYTSIGCTAKYDVYSVAIEMIRFLYFTANGSTSHLGFDDLIRMCILRTNDPDIRTIGEIQAEKLVVTNDTLLEDIIIAPKALMPEMNQASHSYFMRAASGYRKLVLCIQPALGELLKKCLMFEDRRPTAEQALDALYEFTAMETPIRNRSGGAKRKTSQSKQMTTMTTKKPKNLIELRF